MKPNSILLALLAVASLVVASCSSNDDDGDDALDFNAFVQSKIATTSDTSEPTDINGVDFAIAEDEHAFDNLFQ